MVVKGNYPSDGKAISANISGQLGGGGGGGGGELPPLFKI